MRVSSANVTKPEICNLDLNFELVKTTGHWRRDVCRDLESSRRCLHSTGQLRCVHRTLMCAQNAEVCTELLCVHRTLIGVDSAEVCCAQNAGCAQS